MKTIPYLLVLAFLGGCATSSPTVEESRATLFHAGSEDDARAAFTRGLIEYGYSIAQNDASIKYIQTEPKTMEGAEKPRGARLLTAGMSFDLVVSVFYTASVSGTSFDMTVRYTSDDVDIVENLPPNHPAVTRLVEHLNGYGFE